MLGNDQLPAVRYNPAPHEVFFGVVQRDLVMGEAGATNKMTSATGLRVQEVDAGELFLHLEIQ